MDDCCQDKGREIERLARQADQRRVLCTVLTINAIMFAVEFSAGLLARSTALLADSVDMFGDASVYALSLYALDRGTRWRAGAALVKGVFIFGFGLWVLVEVGLKISYGVTPMATVMAGIGALALAANLICLALLWRFRNHDVNMSSTFQCSRNDVIANLGVLGAAAGVSLANSAWPDILVGLLIAALFIRSAARMVREAWPQFRTADLQSRAH